jgi:glutamate dehydrogenase
VTIDQAKSLEDQRIEEILERIERQLPPAEAPLAAAFTRELFRWVAPEDLEARSPADLYGAAVGLWRFVRQRSPSQARVRVFNPTLEEHGWQSTHTVVEIVNPDMPFLVDSVSMALNRRGLTIHLVMHPVIAARRDERGELRAVESASDASPEVPRESIMHVEVDRRTDPGFLLTLRFEIDSVLEDVRVAVEDWRPMRDRLRSILELLETGPAVIPAIDRAEVAEFLRWIDQDHFTFLGYREYELRSEGVEDVAASVDGSGLGILRDARRPRPSAWTPLPPRARALAREPELLILTKANARSTVHRPIRLDYVGVKKFDAAGMVIGERRFLGLYTDRAYHSNPWQIPIVRRKVDGVLERAGVRPPSHAGKALVQILETLPRDELFQASEAELYELAVGILQLEDRQRVRVFLRPDRYRRFFAVLVFAPRDRYNTEAREKIQRILLEELHGTDIEFSLSLGESILARIYFVVQATPTADGDLPACDVEVIERRIAEAVRDWRDDLARALHERFGEERASALQQRYAEAFPPGYRDDFEPRAAVSDIERAESLHAPRDLALTIYRRTEEPPSHLRIKLFRRGEPIFLSEMLPILENMGLRVIGEHPYAVRRDDDVAVYLHDFEVLHTGAHDLELAAVEPLLREALSQVWHGAAENDGFNRLVVGARLRTRQVTVLRAACKYLLQGGVAWSQVYMEQTLASHPAIARALVELFECRLDPVIEAAERDRRQERLGRAIRQELEEVPSLDDDRILRGFLAVIEAVLRTNYYQRDAAGEPKPYLAVKLDAHQLAFLPLPRPRFEIFVYSPRVEGVHLRGGKVARGGIRFSDRREDFRTEVLGLLKAQMVKNAVIVPVGAKGGFVAKRLPSTDDRDAVQAEVIDCYRTFIQGLLDLTDNIVAGEVAPPSAVVRRDDDDPYLVVAADKGTATFSDFANEIAVSRGFWLGDGFASGGSAGYDHKEMGITARGAWESVRRHFRELGRDVDREEITVAGIGDMAGDVFGNGMLRSRHLKLVAAFNHRHIFLDPDPDPERSFAERERLFHLPTSSWADYDAKLISEGGGVYTRLVKSIAVSPQARAALGIEEEKLTPAELIHRILRAPVDLLWNGGIGTFVKASSESHEDVDDRANDALRADGSQLRAKVVAEGGNLGFTQRGRIEYALAGGRINTDSLDNSAGVDTSDHEVNIKILLNSQVAAGELTRKHRDQQLEAMTEEVASLVLRDNYQQALAVSVAEDHARESIEAHARMIRALERDGRLDRALEALPSDDELAQRKAGGRGLVRPELAILLAYAKIDLKADLLETTAPDDPYFATDLECYFPTPLRERFAAGIHAHRLRRQIVATSIVNSLVNRTGPSFAYRIQDDTGAPTTEIVRAYLTSRELYRLRGYWQAVEDLDGKVPAALQAVLFYEAEKLLERASRWFIRRPGRTHDIAAVVAELGPGVDLVKENLERLLFDRTRLEEATAALVGRGAPPEVARAAARLDLLFPALDIVDVARERGLDVLPTATLYFRAGGELGLLWLRSAIARIPAEVHWHRLAGASAIDEIYRIQRAVTAAALAAGDGGDPAQTLERWKSGRAEALARLRQIVAELKAAAALDWAMVGVALREARALVEEG